LRTKWPLCPGIDGFISTASSLISSNRFLGAIPEPCYSSGVSIDFSKVSTEAVTKLYGVTRALAGVDAEFQAGEVTVIEGPNGSGKSTLLHILAQEARPSSGLVRYDGRRIRRGRLRAQIGVLAHQSMLYPDLNADENLSLFASLYQVTDPATRIETLKERFHIGRFAARPARTWSRGQLQRVALARTLLGTPRLLLLDEPSTGLDTRSVELLIAAIAQERTRGAIVVVVTHDQAFSSEIADTRVRLKQGRVADAPLSNEALS